MALKPVFENLKDKKESAFIPFLTMGFPSLEEMHELLMAAQEGGADILELGIPFSDPVADGPTIQHTSNVAIENGMNLTLALEMLKESRHKGFSLPVVLMGYANPFYAFGLEKLGPALKDAGVDGLIIPDLPPSESDEFMNALKGFNIDIIFFISPTTTEKRISSVVEKSSGFIYCVSTKGVTGADLNRNYTDIEQLIKRCKQKTDLPICVGFGISTEQQINELTPICEGVIMASKLLTEISSTPHGERASKYKESITKFKSKTLSV